MLTIGFGTAHAHLSQSEGMGWNVSSMPTQMVRPADSTSSLNDLVSRTVLTFPSKTTSSEEIVVDIIGKFVQGNWTLVVR